MHALCVWFLCVENEVCNCSTAAVTLVLLFFSIGRAAAVAVTNAVDVLMMVLLVTLRCEFPEERAALCSCDRCIRELYIPVAAAAGTSVSVQLLLCVGEGA